MAPSVKGAARSALGVFFEYDTPRIVHIRSKKVGVINRLIQLAIIGYIIGYVIVYKKGYQDFDSVQSSVTTKVKGIVFSDFGPNSTIGKRTWDVADYIIPPQETNGFFVMTNVIVTPKQSQTNCAEDPGVKNINCTQDEDCIKLGVNTIPPGGNGALTGKCIPSDVPGVKYKVCQIYGWCPLEQDKLDMKRPVLQGARNFTVFIKNNIEFPKFGVSRRNLIGILSEDELKSCRWKRGDAKNKFCPIFVLDDIAKDAGVTFESMTMEGGVMQIVIDWTCNLDYSEDDCVPEYTFRRLDKGDYNFSRGFNFRYADQFMLPVEENNHTEYRLFRTLYKAYGVRFLLTVQGTAGKFSIVPLLLNVGSGLALLGVATIICDIVVLYLLKAKNFYREKKYLDVKGQDAYEAFDNDNNDEDGGKTASGRVKRRTTLNQGSEDGDGGSSSQP